MGSILVENKLEFDFRLAASSLKFDDPFIHQLSHCMKSVDFIVEDASKVYYIEVKDLDNPLIPVKERSKYQADLMSGAMVSSILAPKARDSFLYNYLLDRLPVDKPVIYIVLIALSALTAAELDLLTNYLKVRLPLSGPASNPWIRPYFSACLVMNVAVWNRAIPNFPVRRLP